MPAAAEPNDLELAALMSSKICHDVIGPVGAIYNGLEVLDEDDDAETQAFALHEIRSFTEQASAKLQFARFAFGAAGGIGAVLDLSEAEKVARGFVESAKHKLVWAAPRGHLAKNHAKLLLNLVASALAALPRGGAIEVRVEGELSNPALAVCCSGEGARAPRYLPDFIAGHFGDGIDALSVQAYYTCRLARSAGLALTIAQAGSDIVLRATPI